jgi:hypothetical protein
MVELSFNQWWICIGIAFSLVVVEELIKFFIRRRNPAKPEVAVAPAMTAVAAGAGA